MALGKLYLQEIDSLRALSVLGVIVFHLDRGLLPGGYTGVDCFFVISGFVVTHSLMRLQPVSLLDLLQQFYARRLRRIAPALMAVLLVTTLASMLFIPSSWLSKRNEEIGMAAFFGVSNLLLIRPTNAYFGPVAEFNPFTHTWSLGIEEQFYLVAPLILFLALKRPGTAKGRRTALLLTGLLSLASLAVCAVWTSQRANFAFYLLPARFWELGSGVALALSQDRWQSLVRRRTAAGAAILLGFLALAASMLYADPQTFPFPWAMLSVTAAGLLIMGIAGQPEGILPWPLSSGAFQYIGRMSYSLYLWHWPVFVLFLWTVGLQTWATRLVALFMAVSLAIVSYEFVEIPTRSAKLLRGWRPSRVVFAGVALIGFSAFAGSMLFRSEQLLSLSRVAYEERTSSIPALPGSAGCHNEFALIALGEATVQTFKPVGCTRPPSAHRMFVIGDSHAIGYAPMLDRYAADTAHEVRILRRDGCPLISLVDTRKESSKCEDYLQAAGAYLRREARPGDLLFFASLRLPRFANQWGSPDALQPVLRARRDEARAKLLVDEAVAQLQFVRDEVIVFEAPKPLFRSQPFRCSDWFNAANPVCAGGSRLTREEFGLLREPVMAAMGQVAGRLPNIRIWDPAVTLCRADGCNAYADGRALFFDGDHLSVLGNAAVYPPFAAYIASVWE